MAFFPTRQIFLEIGPVAIHWYGLMYLFAFLVTWWLLPRLAKYRGLTLTSEQYSTLLTYGILGTLIGGRLGYVTFYAPEYFADHPWDILSVWQGGMSFHGGLLGVILALFLFARKEKVNFWQLMDIVTVPAAIGLALGRFGNFINQELYGPVTTLPWSMRIPGVEGLRHPTPLYAMMKDLFIAGACFLHLRVSPKNWSKPGITSALFLIFYGLLRFSVEFIRIETATGLDIGSLHLTRGQLLSIPLIILGIALFWTRDKKS